MELTPEKVFEESNARVWLYWNILSSNLYTTGGCTGAWFVTVTMKLQRLLMVCNLKSEEFRRGFSVNQKVRMIEYSVDVLASN